MEKNNYRIIGVDFDKTLCASHYPGLGDPITEVIDYVKECQEKEGAYVILITMREGQLLDDAVEWCKSQGLEFDALNDNLPHMKEFFGNNPRKIYCSEYIDDTNIGGIELILAEIRKKKEAQASE